MWRNKMDIKEVVNILLSTQKCNDYDERYVLKSRWEITSHRKYIGFLIVFVKKIIRKGIFWYIDPIVKQQNNINAMLKNIDDKKVKELDNKIIEKLVSELAKTNKRLDEIVHKNNLKE